jgi:hypothetical protein
MLSCQHQLWLSAFEDFVLFLDEEKEDMSTRGKNLVFAVHQLYHVCQKFETFERCCNKENLTLLCDAMRLLRGSGAARKFPLWPYIVSQFHLFLLEVQYKAAKK